jgi:hypothetical protein
VSTAIPPVELPADNAARIAIFDVLSDAAAAGQVALTDEELFDRVIGRLRVLVPRELHLLGERAYVREKVEACIDGRIVERAGDAPQLLTLTGEKPLIRYPDAKSREYDAGLEAARERLEQDDAKLRRRGFDVRTLVPSLADAPESDGFRALVASMQEHGYLKQFPIQLGANGDVIDGRARIAAAADAEVPVAQMKERLPRRRDTPLHRVLLALAANWARVTDEERERVYDAVSAKAERSWSDIEADLALTRAWRRMAPREYTPWFDVKKVRYREDEPPRVQITKDRKVGLRSLVVAAGLSSYKIQTTLKGYLFEHKARTAFSGNQGAIFVDVDDAIRGIGNMMRDRREKNQRIEKEWKDIRNWLIRHSSSGPEGESSSISEDLEAAPTQQQLV